MKKIIFRTVQFILTTCSIYLVIFTSLYFLEINKNASALNYVSKTLRSKGGSHAFKSFQEFELYINQKKKFDFIVLGSSQAYRGYDPRLFKEYGYALYNLGTSSQRFWQTKIIAETYIDSTNTKAVIIDIYMGGIDGKSMESTINLIQNLPSFKSAAYVAWQSKDIRSVNILMLRKFDDLFKSSVDSTVQYYHPGSRYVSGGFSETYDTVNIINELPSSRFYQSNTEYLEQLKKTVELLVNRGVNVFLIMTPQPKEFLPSNKEYMLFDIQMAIKGIENVEVLDLGWNLNLDSKKHFYDHRHLNQYGVEIFNRKLIPQLKNNLID